MMEWQPLRKIDREAGTGQKIVYLEKWNSTDIF